MYSHEKLKGHKLQNFCHRVTDYSKKQRASRLIPLSISLAAPCLTQKRMQIPPCFKKREKIPKDYL